MITERDAALYAEYVGGLTAKQVASRHGIDKNTVFRAIYRVSGMTGVEARAISLAARREAECLLAEQITNIAARVFDLPPGLIWTATHRRAPVRARFAAWLVCKEHGLASKSIAASFEMDHSSIINGQQQAEIFARCYPDYAERLQAVRDAAAGIAPAQQNHEQREAA